MNLQTLGDFLNHANKSTYANKDAAKAISTRLGSEDYHFEEGDYVYHDTYFGGSDFIGGEIVYEKQRPVWGMNYYGYVLDNAKTVKEVYDFLRRALMSECGNVIPVRGPRLLEVDEWRYTNEPLGTLDRFVGKENIFFGGTLLYRCDYHGGFVL